MYFLRIFTSSVPPVTVEIVVFRYYYFRICAKLLVYTWLIFFNELHHELASDAHAVHEIYDPLNLHP